MKLKDLKQRLRASEPQQFKPKKSRKAEDPITGRVIIINPNRALRRVAFHKENLKRTIRREDCHYCKGETPSTLFYIDKTGNVELLHEIQSLQTALASLKARDTSKVSVYYQMIKDISNHTLPGGGWLTRTFLNLVPPLTDYPELSLVTAVNPKYHYKQMHQIPTRVLGATVLSWQVIEELANSSRMTQVPFINGGNRPESGQSIFCFHSQVYITQTPPLYRQIARRRAEHGCGVCRVLRKRTLNVYANRQFKVMVHPAPTRNHSLLIAPKRCVARLRDVDPDLFADALKVSLTMIRTLTGALPAYNIAVRCGKPVGHLHAEFVPKTETNIPAGFEEATHTTLITEEPSEVAAILKKPLS